MRYGTYINNKTFRFRLLSNRNIAENKHICGKENRNV